MALDIVLRNPGVKHNIAFGSTPALFEIDVLQTMPTPEQSGTLAIVVPVNGLQTAPEPTQAGTLVIINDSEFSVNQNVPKPSQIVRIDSGQTLVKFGNAGASYYPPIYKIRTKGAASVPAPKQLARVNFGYRSRAIEIGLAPSQIATANLGTSATGKAYGPMPAQGGAVVIHRPVKVRDDEENVIMMLLGVA